MWMEQVEGGICSNTVFIRLSGVWLLEGFGSSYTGTRTTFLSYSTLCRIRIQLEVDGETGQTSFNLDFYGCQLAQTKIQLLYGCQTGLMTWERYLLYHNKVESSSLVKFCSGLFWFLQIYDCVIFKPCSIYRAYALRLMCHGHMWKACLFVREFFALLSHDPGPICSKLWSNHSKILSILLPKLLENYFCCVYHCSCWKNVNKLPAESLYWVDFILHWHIWLVEHFLVVP